MSSAWFGGSSGDRSFMSDYDETQNRNSQASRNKRISMKEAAQVMYPQKRSILVSGYGGGRSKNAKSRFSTLLLDHGEKHVQDWAVMAYSNPSEDSDTGLIATSSSTRTSKQPQGTIWAAKSGSMYTPRKSKRHNKLDANSTQGTISKESHPSVFMNKWDGRLHLCSKSLVFEPTDLSRGIIRIPFSKMPEGPPKEYPSKSELLKMTADQTGQAFETMGVELLSTRHWVMRENGSIGPYESIHTKTRFRLTFLHSSPSTLVDLCQRLFPLLQSKNHEAMEELFKSMYDRPFDFQANLLDAREKPLLQSSGSSSNSSGALPCQWMQPLQNQPGCIVVTQERIYFQLAKGVLETEYAASESSSWLLHSQLLATARRYKGLEDSALELFWKDGTSSLFGFDRKHDREQVLRLMPLDIPCHTDRDFLLETYEAWKSKSISNLDYLLLLNSVAGRSFQDLSRYPVVPWIIKDYESKKLDLTKRETFRDLSKPIGALNPERLRYFQQRFEGMQDAVDFPFLYGTHYSAAGYVLYYLIRSMPEHMLCLQNGKFDAPDRMFHNVSHTFSTLLTNHADVKELIPEFYNPNSDFDFLINTRGLQLGATQRGDRVDDVVLPPWAKSPRDFIKKNAKAMETDICTEMLPRWIDLVFGCKSRGEPAKEACNLFHRYAYMGPADLANLPSSDERYQAELHATEFGLVPDQLFVGPHPLRHETVDESFVSDDIGRTFSGTEELGKGEAWELLESPSVMKAVGAENDNLNSFAATQVVDHDALDARDKLEVFGDFGINNNHSEGNSDVAKTIPLSGSGENVAVGSDSSFSLAKEPTLSNVSSTSDFNKKPNTGQNTKSPSEWDIRYIERSTIHDDAVSGCSLLPVGAHSNDYVIVTTSLDGGLKVHTLPLLGKNSNPDRNQFTGITSTLSRFSYMAMSRGTLDTEKETKLTESRSHTSRDPLACLAMTSDGHGGKVAFAGGHDDVVMAYGVNSGCAVASVYSHRDAVTGLNLLARPTLLATTPLWVEKATHVMVSGSWDATIKVWSVTVANGETVSIDREPLAELFDADSSIVSVAAIAIQETGSIVIAAGCADGSFCVWTIHSDRVKVVVHKEGARRGSGPCSAVQWSIGTSGEIHLFAGFATGKVASYSLTSSGMRKNSSVSVGVAVQCLQYFEGILLIGCSDGGLRLIPIQDGSHFSSDLSVWPAIHKKTASGISSIDITITNGGTENGKFVCCTGAEDGSLAIFELKRVNI